MVRVVGGGPGIAIDQLVFEGAINQDRAVADWLSACRVTSVAMEATGVYWIPLYEILEARGS